jgi:hypothetical protein
MNLVNQNICEAQDLKSVGRSVWFCLAISTGSVHVTECP